MLRSFSFYVLIALTIYALLNISAYTRRTMAASSLAGWHNRALESPYKHSFSPDRSALRLAVLRNAPVEPEGFTLALFDSPVKIAVDSLGRVLSVTDSDFDGLVALAEKTKELPETGEFRNTWFIQQPITSRPIDRILLPTSSKEYKETSVQGYNGGATKLKNPVDGFEDLPQVLQDLVAVVLEAREDGSGGDRDEGIINQVKSILGNVF